MWTKEWFFKLMHKYDCGELTTEQVWDYVDLHSSASNDANRLLPAVFLSGKDKVEQFQKELKALLVKYDAEIEIQEFGRDCCVSDEKMVVTFNWDEDLSNRTGDGGVPQLIIGSWENGR